VLCFKPLWDRFNDLYQLVIITQWKEKLISVIVKVSRGREGMKEAEKTLDAELAHIPSAEAAKPKICSVQVKPTAGTANQGSTIFFGDGRTVIHILEVQEHQNQMIGKVLLLVECHQY